MRQVRKLQPYQVILLRQMRREGFRRKWLAKLFGISINAIYQILRHSTYKDVR